MTKEASPGTCRGVCVKRWSDHVVVRRGDRCYGAFTLIELVVVTGIILILTGLVLSTVGYARKKGARARAETEIAALSAACESYKADNAIYPRDNTTTNHYTDTLNAQKDFDPTQTRYQNASFYLYTQLSGDSNGSRNPS